MEHREKCVVWVEPFNQLEICRVCLKGPSNLYDIRTYGCSDVFNTFVDVPEWCSEKLPKYICFYCKSLLLKCVEFKRKCRKICSYFYEGNWEKELMINNELKARLKKLTISDVEVIDWVPVEEVNLTQNDSNNINSSDNVKFKSEDNEDVDNQNQIIDYVYDSDYIIGNLNVIGEVPIQTKAVSMDFEDIFVDEICVNDEDVMKESKSEFSCKKESDCKKETVAQHMSNELFGDAEAHIANSTLEKIDLVSMLDKKQLESNKKFSNKSKSIEATKKTTNTSMNNIIDEHSYEDIQDNVSVDSEDTFLEGTENEISKNDEKGLQTKKNTKNTKIETKDEKTNTKKPERSKFVHIPDDEFSKMYEVEIVRLTKEEQLEVVRKRKMEKESGKGKLRFSCDICYKDFLSEAAFKNHIRAHDSARGKYMCDICYLYYPKKTYLHNHIYQHRKLFICKICKTISNIPFHAKLHYMTKHAGKILDCPDCGITFNSHRTKFNHVRKIHKAVKCDICQENMFGANSLLRHKRDVHGGLDVFNCAKCKVRFRYSAAYDVHKVNCDVASGRKFCSVCGDGFENDDALQSHMKEKHDKKGFDCKECPASFKSDYLLAKHWSLKHSVQETSKNPDKVVVVRRKAKTFMCEVCGMSYDKSIKLKYHMLKHTGERPFKCSECEKAFKSAAQLKVHFTMKHKYDDPDHIDAKPYKCDFCPKRFKSSGGMSRHRQEHVTPAGSLRPHLCSLCGKGFKQKPHLAAHILTHTLEKPFACKLCEKRYRCSTSLSEHVDTVHRGLPPRRRKRKHEDKEGE